MDKKVVLEFESEIGSKEYFTVPNVKEGITAEEVTELANDIISKNIFFTKTGDYIKFIGAKVETKTVETIV